MKKFCEYYYLNNIVSINPFNALNITENITLKYYHKQALNKKLKLIGDMKYFSKKLLEHEIFICF